MVKKKKEKKKIVIKAVKRKIKKIEKKENKKKVVKKKIKKIEKKENKKKIIKKQVRKIKKLKIRPVQKSPEQIKKDLSVFTKGVERLKELENEINSLDTRGFYKEEQTIRAKLKNVSDIPIIETAIKNLKLKINKKYKPKHKKKSPYNQIIENIDEVMGGVPKIEKHFAKLKAEVEKVSRLKQKAKNKKLKEKSKEFKCPRCGDVVSFESTAISESGIKVCSACKLIENFK